MSAQRQRAVHKTRELTPLPEDLRSPRAKLVFHSLDAAGQAPADELAGRLSMRKTALLSILKTLERRGLVENDGGEYAVAA